MKRQKKEIKQGDWMGTYGDMVTLLLCFFVLLYSISSVDQQKWERIVKSFNPNAQESNAQIVTDVTLKEGEDEVPGQMDKPDVIEKEFEDLYYTLTEVVASQGMQNNVEITKGDDFTFISFQDLVFFDGYSPVLREEGKEILRQFGAALGNVDNAIQQVEVLGHTAQASPELPNEIHTDRLLSAQRSGEVVAFLHENTTLTPSKLMSSAFGEYRPIASSDTTEGRAKNRRVEILITKSDAVQRSLDEYYQQAYQQE